MQRANNLLLALLLCATGFHASAIEIIPAFDSSITDLSNGSDVMLSIRAACFEYRYRLAESVPVNINFRNMTNGLGASVTPSVSVTYQDYRAKLEAHKTSILDGFAVASLPDQAANPVNGNTNMLVKVAHARAMGFHVVAGVDSTIHLNTAILKVSPASAYPALGYSLYATLCHEIDEALGFNSILNGRTNAPFQLGPIAPEDLFRFDSNDGSGHRVLDTISAAAYFYIPGFGEVGRFNVQAGGDYQDWYSDGVFVPARVQNAYGTPLADPRLKDDELNAFDAIGYTILPTPVWLDIDNGSDLYSGGYFFPFRSIATADSNIGSGGAIMVNATTNPTLHTTRISLANPAKLTAFNGTLRIAP